MRQYEAMHSTYHKYGYSRLSLSDHVASVCRSGYYQLRPVVRCSSEDATKTLVQAFISSRLDYCNVLYYGIYDELIRRLQSVQYAAASLVVKVLDAHQYFRCLI